MSTVCWERVVADVMQLSRLALPDEACGFIVQTQTGYSMIQSVNKSRTPTTGFKTTATSYLEAKALGIVVAIYHSHPGNEASAYPSQADRVSCESSRLPWLIVAPANQSHFWVYPEGYIAPYEGREWSYGVLDCYALVRDWYSREMDIVLTDYDRPAEPDTPMYIEEFQACGFVEKPEISSCDRGDVLLMKIGTKHPSHAAVYLGDGKILHHLTGRPSIIREYTGPWQRRTKLVLRWGVQADAA